MFKRIVLRFCTVLIVAMAIALVGCEGQNKHTHSFADEWTSDDTHHWHAATCEHNEEVKDKAEHAWNDGEITTPATCGADGVKTYTCTVCRATKTEILEKIAHTYAEEWTSDDTHHWHAATCEHNEEIKDKAEHAWNNGEITTPATCGADGVKTYTCSVCGATKTEILEKIEHTYSDEWTSDDTHHWHAATCEHNEEIKDKAEHAWNNGEITKPATCGADGVKTYTCTVCSATKTEILEKIEHTYSDEWTSDDTHHWHAATCEHNEEIKDKAEHAWNNGEITTPATCGADGTKTYTCTVCGATKTEILEKIEHTYSDEWTSDDTHHWHAATCEHREEIKDKAEHAWNDGEITTPVTCGVDGVKTYTCTVCNATKTESVEKKAHSFANEWTTNDTHHWHAATCEHSEEIKDKAEHDFENECDPNCSVCSYTREVKHNYVNGECTICHAKTALTDAELNAIINAELKNYTMTVVVAKSGEPDREGIIKVDENNAYVAIKGATFSYMEKDYSEAYIERDGGDGEWQLYLQNAEEGYALKISQKEVGGFENIDFHKIATLLFGGRDISANNAAVEGDYYVWEVGTTLVKVKIIDGRMEQAAAYSQDRSVQIDASIEQGKTAVALPYAANDNPFACKHVFGKSAITLPACEENGAVAGNCSMCGAAKSYTLSAKGHVPNRLIEKNKHDEESHWDEYVCGVCHETILVGKEAHPYDGYGYCGVCKHWRAGSGGENQNYGQFTYAFDAATQTYSISKFREYYGVGKYELDIPSVANDGEHGSHRITSIGDYAFYGCYNMTRVNIHGKITSIGDYAFFECAALMSVNIPMGTKSIGAQAFRRCDNVSVITISVTVTSIGDKAFDGCNNIESATVPTFAIAQIPQRKLTKVILNSGTSIGDYAFEKCGSLASITIPLGVKSIGKDAFYGCYRLVEIINQSGLNIEKGSAANGYAGFYALSVKKGGTSEVVNDNGYLFFTCGSTNYLFGYNGADRALVLPDDYNGQSYEIYGNAFRGRRDLTSIMIGSGVSGIGEGAFEGCCGLGYNVDGGVRYLGNKENPYLYLAGAQSADVTTVTINRGCKFIGEKAFYDCKKMVSITIPLGVKSIGKDAFYGCNRLVEVINQSGLNIEKGSVANGYAGFYALSVKKGGASEVVNDNGYLFFAANNVNYLIAYIGESTQLTLPQNFNGQSYEIYVQAFRGDKRLTSITINGTTKIGASVFEYCTGLQSVTIGSGVATIESAAFWGCKSLTSITIGSGVKKMGSAVFYGCENLKNIVNLSSLDIESLVG